MKVSLSEGLESYVKNKVAAGNYNSTSEMVREALHLLKEKDDKKQVLMGALQQGFQDIEAGQISKPTHPINKKYFNLESKISGFQNLHSNWDSYDADPTAAISISKAIETLGWLYKNGFLSSNIEIDVFPMRDGGIQFEFEHEKASSELEIDKEGICTYIFYNESDGLLDKIQIYELSELKILLENLPNETKRVSLAGTFSDETTALFKEHLNTIRNEWE